MFNREYIFKGSIFYCHVSLPECKPWKARLFVNGLLLMVGETISSTLETFETEKSLLENGWYLHIV